MDQKDRGLQNIYGVQSNEWRAISQEYRTKMDEWTTHKLDSIASIMKDVSADYKALVRLRAVQEEILKDQKAHHDHYLQLKAYADEYEFRSNESEVDTMFLGARMNARFFKVKNATHAQMYFNGSVDDQSSKFLKNSLFSFSSNGQKVSLFNELYSDYLGPFRLHFGALISGDLGEGTEAPEDEKMDDAVQRLIGGGGNVVLGISYPIFDLSTLHKTFSSKIHFSPKMGFDIPELGQSVETSTTNVDVALEGSFFLKGLEDIISLYGGFRYGYLIGSQEFEKNLNIDQNFWLGQFTIGLALNSAFRISYTRNFSSLEKSVLDLNNTISFSIVPN